MASVVTGTSVGGSVASIDAILPVPLPAGLVLSQLQLRVLDYLAKHWGRHGLDRRFVGGLRVYSDQENPERICLTAHCLREIMNAMEETETAKRPARLNDRFQSFLREVSGSRKAAQRLLDSDDSAQVDLKLTTDYVRMNEKFLEAFEQEQEVWNRRAETILTSIDSLFKYEAAGWRARIVKEWRAHKDVFNEIAHSTPVAEGEFNERFERWMEFLLARGRPQTTSHQSHLLAQIQALET